MDARIDTERFNLRELTQDDASPAYLGWFRDPVINNWIAASSTTQNLCDLRLYIKERMNRDDVLFLGIFDQFNSRHIGNIKYEPIVREKGEAVMGVLLGDPRYRGIGVFSEIFLPSASWLKIHRGIKRIYLGVACGNLPAINAYKKVGFEYTRWPTHLCSNEALAMVFEI